MNYLGKAFAGASLAALAGCQTGSPYGELIGPVGGGYQGVVMSEAPDYSTQRTRIYNQPMQCTVTTHEQGRVRGGQAVYNDGTASRSCVSTDDSYYRGNQMRQAQDAINDVTDTIYAIRGLQNALRY